MTLMIWKDFKEQVGTVHSGLGGAPSSSSGMDAGLIDAAFPDLKKFLQVQQSQMW
jgi:hypothetical protein